MRIPVISIYRPEDHDEVVALIRAHGYEVPMSPEELMHGLGLVARDERDESRPVIGFIWALVAKGNPVSYVDYFVIRQDVVGSNVGAWVVGTMTMMLREHGVRKIVGFVPMDHHRTLKMFVNRGARDLGIHHVIELPIGEVDNE